MTDEVSLALSWFANYSNFYSVLSVILCFCVMVVFILRLNGDHFMTSSATHYNIVQEQKMVVLHNPFAVQLDASQRSSLTNSLHLMLSARSDSKAKVYWGVNIKAFQKELQLSVDKIADRYDSGDVFDKEFLHADYCGLLTPEIGCSVTSLPCPAVLTEEVLGEPPRSLYPAVVAMMLCDHDISKDYTAIVLQFTVIHMKDSLCRLDSHIVYQFVKTNHSKVISLQPIFPSTSNQDHHTSSQSSTTPGHTTNTVTTPHTDTDQPESLKNPSTLPSTPDHQNRGQSETTSDSDMCHDIDDACCVCQNAPVSYTLLPCRHACVCNSCMKLLDRCPICRSYIDTYFRLGNIPDGDSDGLDSDPVQLTRWQAFNQRLNEILGLS